MMNFPVIYAPGTIEVLALTARAISMIEATKKELDLNGEEVIAWVDQVKADRKAQYENEAKRFGEKQGSGATKRVLGPNGWELPSSLANMRTAEEIAALDPSHAPNTTREEAQAQAEIREIMIEHEVTVLMSDLRIFTITRRTALGDPRAQRMLGQLSADELAGVQARLMPIAFGSRP